MDSKSKKYVRKGSPWNWLAVRKGIPYKKLYANGIIWGSDGSAVKTNNKGKLQKAIKLSFDTRM